MKFLMVDTYYPSSLKNFWKKNAKDKDGEYKILLKKILDEKLFLSDYYSSNLIKLGHKAIDIIANDEVLQLKWAKEKRISVIRNPILEKVQSLPYIYRFIKRPKWMEQILLEQISFYKPDIVYFQDLTILSPSNLRLLKRNNHFVVGQIASPLPPENYLKEFDLILTSFSHFVPKIHRLGVHSEYFRIGFAPDLVHIIGKQEKKYDITFIGSFTPHHSKGSHLLERVAKDFSLHVWGRGLEFVSPISPLRANFHGQIWGKAMFEVLAQSKIVINRHIDVARNHANNMRLYEATGMGALLITDYKKNISELFKVGKEIITYNSIHDLQKKLNYFLIHDNDRVKIARAGQKRTLKAHSYKRRMQELVKIISQYKKFRK